MASDAPWLQLHPGTLAVNLLPRVWGSVRAFWPLLLAFLYGRGSVEVWSNLFFLALFTAIPVYATAVHYATLRYRVSEGRLEVRSGLLNRQLRVIAPERIQNMEMVRNVFHRVTGLVEVRIETASGREVEGLLSALSVEAAQDLMARLGRVRREPTGEAPRPLAGIGLMQLAQYGATTGRLGAIGLAVAFGFELIDTGDPEQMAQLSRTLGVLGGSAALLALVTGAFLFGILGSVARHYGFTLVQEEDVLVTQEGLFTKRRVELPVEKVQLVTVHESWIRRLLGFGSVHIETAAAGEGRGGVDQAEAVIPVVPSDRIWTLVSEAVPALSVDVDRLELLPPHPRALLRMYRQALGQVVFAVAVLVWWQGLWGLLGIGLVVPALVVARKDWEHQGYRISGDWVVARRGWLTRTTQVLDLRKLQSSAVAQGPLLRLWGLGQLSVRVAGNGVTLPTLSWQDVRRLQATLAPAEASPALGHSEALQSDIQPHGV